MESMVPANFLYYHQKQYAIVIHHEINTSCCERLFQAQELLFLGLDEREFSLGKYGPRRRANKASIFLKILHVCFANWALLMHANL